MSTDECPNLCLGTCSFANVLCWAMGDSEQAREGRKWCGYRKQQSALAAATTKLEAVAQLPGKLRCDATKLLRQSETATSNDDELADRSIATGLQKAADLVQAALEEE